MFGQGRILTNLIEINAELGELFALYWSKVMPPEHRGNLTLPFFHLQSSSFWHLVPQPGQETTLKVIRQVDRLSQFQKLCLGAHLDDELYQLLQVKDSRTILRTVLIQTYFASAYHSILLAQSEVNLHAFMYSQYLIEQARKHIKETPESNYTESNAVRDQGFRRAVVRIYEHRCALCGVQMLTSDGRTAVDAAHIIPWSMTHNDDIHNGMALCGLCHWTFDEGLLGVSTKYRVVLSM